MATAQVPYQTFWNYLHCTAKHRTFVLNKYIMEAQISKDERIELRVSSADKRIFKKAQKLSGDKSFSSFVVRIVKKKAEEIVAKNDRIITTEKDRQVFFDAVFSNTKPNQSLVAAAKRYKSKKA
jgi:uncharacterized protein (DUF1778 family)